MSPTALEALERPIGDEIRGGDDSDELDIVRNDLDVQQFLLDLYRVKKFSVDVRASVEAADVEMSIDGAHQLTMTVRDTDRTLYRSGSLGYSIDMKVEGWWWRLVRRQKQDDDLVLTFEPREVAWMSAHKTKRKVRRGKSTRAEFIRGLVKAVKKHEIKFYSPELHKKQPVKKATQRDERGRKERHEAGFDNDYRLPDGSGGHLGKTETRNAERVLTVGDSKNARTKVQIATVMCVYQESGFKTSATNGNHVGLFQQDPRYWPATREPERDANAFYNRILINDRERPNLTLPELVESVQASGQPGEYAKWREEAEKVVDAFGGGTGGDGSRTVNKPYEFKVEKGENYFGAAVRLAEEVNWRFFLSKPYKFTYMSEDDMAKAKSRWRIKEGKDGVDWINFDDDDRKRVTEVRVTVRMKMWPVPIGSVVTVDDGGSADGKYIVASMKRSYFSQFGEIVLRKPTEPKPEPRPETKTIPGKSSGGVSGSVDDIHVQGKWAGTESIFNQFVHPFMDDAGLTPGSQKRATKGTATGGVSDHWLGKTNAYATDYGTMSGERIARKLARAFGWNDWQPNSYNTTTVKIDGKRFRVQILWGSGVGHGDHIHVGIMAL